MQAGSLNSCFSCKWQKNPISISTHGFRAEEKLGEEARVEGVNAPEKYFHYFTTEYYFEHLTVLKFPTFSKYYFLKIAPVEIGDRFFQFLIISLRYLSLCFPFKIGYLHHLTRIQFSNWLKCLISNHLQKIVWLVVLGKWWLWTYRQVKDFNCDPQK